MQIEKKLARTQTSRPENRTAHLGDCQRLDKGCEHGRVLGAVPARTEWGPLSQKLLHYANSEHLRSLRACLPGCTAEGLAGRQGTVQSAVKLKNDT